MSVNDTAKSPKVLRFSEDTSAGPKDRGETPESATSPLAGVSPIPLFILAAAVVTIVYLAIGPYLSIGGLFHASDHDASKGAIVGKPHQSTANSSTASPTTTTASVEAKDKRECDAGGDTWWIGVTGVLLASFVSNFGTNIQKVSLDRNSARPEAEQKPSLKQPLWCIGMACMVLGAIVDFAAFPFAAQSLLAPLATTTIVFNIGMANYLSKEQPTLVNVLATCAILVGTIIVVVFGDRCSPVYKTDELVARFEVVPMIMYIVVVIAFLAAGCLYSEKLDKSCDEQEMPVPQRKQVAFVMAAVGGVFGGNTVLCAKTVGEMLKTSASCRCGKGVLNWYTPLFLAALGGNLLMQIKYLNEAIRRFDMLMVIPVYQTFWILSGTFSGLIYFEEYKMFFEEQGPIKEVMFFTGTGMALGGIFLLTREHRQKQVRKAWEAAPEAQSPLSIGTPSPSAGSWLVNLMEGGAHEGDEQPVSGSC